MKQRPFTIGLALGGGASLGFAHIGVLEVLEKNHIIPNYIAGTSMGAVIGGMYSAGLSTSQMAEILKTFDIKKITSLNVFNILRSGLFSTEKMSDYFEKLAGITNIEDTKIPFNCTAVDLYSGKQYIFNQGSFGLALMATTAIPGMFKPVKKDNMLLVDGGVLSNVPFDVCKQMGADFVIAVDVVSHYPVNTHYGSTVNILMSSYSLMQASNEKYRKQSLTDQYNFMLDIPSDKDVLDWSKNSMRFAYENGKKYAQKNIKAIKQALKEFEKKFNCQQK